MSNFLQTPEFFEAKFNEAERLLGKHLLVGISYKGGVIFGKSFNPRSHDALQWTWHIQEKPSIVLAAIGDFRDIVRIKDGLRDFVGRINEIVGGHALTAFAVAKFVSAYFGLYHDEPQCLAAEIVVTDIDANEFFLVSFDGRIKRFADFVVAGCKMYHTPFDEGEVEAETRVALAHGHEEGARIQLSPEMMEKIAQHMVEVRAPAIAFLKKQLARKAYTKRKALAMQSIVMMTLGLFDPPSESEKFEIYFVSRKAPLSIGVDRFVFSRELHQEEQVADRSKACSHCSDPSHHGTRPKKARKVQKSRRSEPRVGKRRIRKR